MKKRLLLLLFPIVILLILYGLFTYSYLEVTINGTGDTTVKLFRQQDQRTTELKGQTRIKKLVPRGSYEVSVKQNDASYFAVAKTGGFLSTTKVQGTPEVERERTFIGNNPGSCMDYKDGLLASYPCGDSFKNYVVHMPATATNPTYAVKTSSANEGYIEGTAKTSEGLVVLLKSPAISEDQGAAHTAYLRTATSSLEGGLPLAGLSDDKYYTMRPYDKGFIVFDSNYEDVFYYSSRRAQPEKLELGKPSRDNFKPYDITVSGNSIAIAYSADTEKIDAERDRTGPSEVIIGRGGTSQVVSLKVRLGLARMCGETKLCGLNGNSLEVYDISNKKPSLLFKVSNITYIAGSSGKLLAVRGGDIIALDIEKQTGYVQYTLGDYQYCGVQEAERGYVLCLINKKSQKTALYIDETRKNSDSIDKKVSKILSLPEITDVSVYGKYIFISPNFGELVAVPPTYELGFDPEVKNSTKSKIQSAIDGAGISSGAYTIVNTLE